MQCRSTLLMLHNRLEFYVYFCARSAAHLSCCCGWKRLLMTAAPGSMLPSGLVGGCPSCNTGHGR